MGGAGMERRPFEQSRQRERGQRAASACRLRRFRRMKDTTYLKRKRKTTETAPWFLLMMMQQLSRRYRPYAFFRISRTPTALRMLIANQSMSAEESPVSGGSGAFAHALKLAVT